MTDPLIRRSPSAHDFQLLIKRLLQAPVVRAPQQEIVYRQRRLTYRDLHARVARLAHALTRLGVKRGDTVAVMDWDSNRYLECFFAVPMIGAVLHTVNVRLSPEQVLYTIDHAEDDFLLVNSELLPLLEQIRGRIDNVKGYVLLTDDPAAALPPGFTGEYEALLAAEPDQFDFPDFDEDTRATTFYTTGTTGLPKGVYFSHRQIALHTLSVLAALGSSETHGRLHRGDVYMPITPMFHVHAWGLPYVATSLGLKQVYPGKYSPEHLLELIDSEKVTFSHCVPTILHMLLRSPRSASVDLSRWKVMVGGAAMSRALCEAALARGIDAISGYGMSETCPVLTIAHLDPEVLAGDGPTQAEVRCKTGRALPLVELRIVDEQGAPQPHDGQATGQLAVRAPWLTQGYLKDEKASERLWSGGWLHTGDVARIDTRGYVEITDRMKDVLKIGGEWVSSLELEDILSHHPGVAEVAVVGAPDPKWGERPLALVVAKPEAKARLTERDLTSHVRGYVDRGTLTKQALLLRAKLVDAIDRTSVGKVDKVTLRRKHLPLAPRGA
ncbi:MAG TPA: fatty acid--CoA ligase [Anaeromyxobacteraceae bacterium]|jgi:fatty-acyl-CoA synthase|nr:fatty acid--CoA ligase [Anaeromyxobacteraceae bacterium]